MPLENHVFITREKMPSPSSWQAAIRKAGFPLEMETQFDVSQFDGFLPCQYQGVGCGFEYFSEGIEVAQAAEEAMLTTEETQYLGNRNFRVTFVTYSDYREAISAVIAAAVLCHMADGVLAEGGESPLTPATKVLAWANDLVTEYKNLIR